MPNACRWWRHIALPGTGYAPANPSAILPTRPPCWFIFTCMTISRFVAGFGRLHFCDTECDWNLATIFLSVVPTHRPPIAFGTAVRGWIESHTYAQTLNTTSTLVNAERLCHSDGSGALNVSRAGRAIDGFMNTSLFVSTLASSVNFLVPLREDCCSFSISLVEYI